MKLTEKDKTFLENLKKLMESKDLWVELKPNRPSYMVLKGTYGEKIHKTFRTTRQGVRWRFYRLPLPSGSNQHNGAAASQVLTSTSPPLQRHVVTIQGASFV